MRDEAGLSVRGLTVARGGRQVVSTVDLDAARGRITALIGPNGAGKSTVLSAIAGLVPYQGRIRLGGVDLDGLAPRARARAVAYVPQRSRLEARLAVRDVVALGRFCHVGGIGRLGPLDHACVRDAMARCGVEHLAQAAYTELSGGEQRRVLIARALSTRAPVLLLDEPTASLDLAHVLALDAYLGVLAEARRTVLVVLHDLAEALRVADQAVLLAEGAVVLHGRSSEVIADEPVRAVYGVSLLPGEGLGYRRIARVRPC